MRLLFSFLILLAGISFAFAETETIVDGTGTETCAISGQVLKVEKWLNAHYEETPSQFNEIYTRLTLLLTDVHSNSFFCKGLQTGHEYTYKLCSTDKPEVGDKIMATAGPAVGTSKYGCLFDIQKIEPEQKKTED